MSNFRSGSTISCIGDLDPEKTKFIVIFDDTYSKPDEWYGPPDPMPSGSTTHYITPVIGFESQEALLEWIKKNEALSGYSKRRFVALPYSPLTIKTEVSIKLG